MFSIMIEQAVAECDRLEKQASVLTEQLFELERSIREIQGLSGMEEIIVRLNEQHAEMNGQSVALRKMLLGLNQVLLCYVNSEKRSCDNGEQTQYFYVSREIEANDLTQINYLLQQI